MQKNIAGTMFYSLLFAIGGAPTIAMLIIQAQLQDPTLVYPVFIGLSVMVACVLVPLILLQNAYLYIKRHDEVLSDRLEVGSQVYLVLNGLCLLYWMMYQFLG
jgi:hypothetical protein